MRTPITPGKRLINTLSAHGLRDTLAELGVDELIPELFETEFDDDGTYHGSFTIDDQLVSYTVGELTVGDQEGTRTSPRGSTPRRLACARRECSDQRIRSERRRRRGEQ